MITFPTFRAGLVGFNPISLAPAVWYSDTGSNAAQWDDISGNGRHATQGTVGFRPSIQTDSINGKQVRRFDGTDDFLSITSAFSILNSKSYAAIFAVVKTNATTTGVNPGFVAFNWAGLGRFGLGVVDSPSQFRASGRRVEADGFSAATQARSTNACIVAAEAVYSSGTIRLGVNSVYTQAIFSSSGSSSANDSVVAEVGRAGTGYINADIAEILVYNTPLTATERRRIELYLAIKYNIAAALP